MLSQVIVIRWKGMGWDGNSLKIVFSWLFCSLETLQAEIWGDKFLPGKN